MHAMGMTPNKNEIAARAIAGALPMLSLLLVLVLIPITRMGATT
jgi:hypothetical protein